MDFSSVGMHVRPEHFTERVKIDGKPPVPINLENSVETHRTYDRLGKKTWPMRSSFDFQTFLYRRKQFPLISS